MLVLMMFVILISLGLSFLVLLGFYLISKTHKFENQLGCSFECGFSSYFYSRFSFSIQYFLIAMIFLFLDLELCVILPVFMGPTHSGVSTIMAFIMVMILLLGLVMEWLESKLDWVV